VCVCVCVVGGCVCLVYVLVLCVYVCACECAITSGVRGTVPEFACPMPLFTASVLVTAVLFFLNFRNPYIS
jgi:hypothetical protein